jgi:hypothetical protein
MIGRSQPVLLENRIRHGDLQLFLRQSASVYSLIRLSRTGFDGSVECRRRSPWCGERRVANCCPNSVLLQPGPGVTGPPQEPRQEIVPACCHPSTTPRHRKLVLLERTGSSGTACEPPAFPGSGKPVTNQVTTTPGNTRRRATRSDTDTRLACGNPTQPDGIRRNRHAW